VVLTPVHLGPPRLQATVRSHNTATVDIVSAQDTCKVPFGDVNAVPA
jgi:hypothetical protein